MPGTRDVFLDECFESIYQERPVVLVDAGARGGLKSNWRAASRHLRVIGAEPDPKEFARLSAAASTDPRGPVYFGAALHNRRGPIRFHLTRDRGLSSIFLPNRPFLDAFPDAGRFDVVDTQDVDADALDALLLSRGIDDVDFVKADTQGSELHVLEGGARTIESSVVGIEVEAEFAPVYVGQPLFADVDAFLRARGFLLFDLRPVYWKRAVGRDAGGPRGELIWGDALYLRSAPAFAAMIEPVDAPHRRSKVLRFLSVALLYGYVDYALEIAHAHAPLFTAEEIAATQRALATRVDSRRRTPRFPGRRQLALASRRLWTWLREPNDGWSVSGADLGNVD